MNTQIERSLNPENKMFDIVFRELNEAIEILTASITIKRAIRHLDNQVFLTIKYGRGGNHIWVSLIDNNRILIATE